LASTGIRLSAIDLRHGFLDSNGKKPSRTVLVLRVLVPATSGDANLPETPLPEAKDTEAIPIEFAADPGVPEQGARRVWPMDDGCGWAFEARLDSS